MAYKQIPAYTRYPVGFECASLHCGIKASAKTSKPDLCLIASSSPCSAAAVFTRNRFQAAPVLYSHSVLQNNPDNIFGVVTNSGCANACTGEKGLTDARTMGETVDDAYHGNRSTSKSLVMSTGVIGQPLPMDRITPSLKKLPSLLSSSHDAWVSCAKAYMTTDTFPKLRVREFTLPHSKTNFRIAGIAKGAGMIHPNMATMLSTIVTDLNVDAGALQQALSYAADRSFNAISVDGDMSTNDTVVLLANGQANTEKQSLKVRDEDFVAFRDYLTDFSAELAKLIVRDGEGATKFITIQIDNVPSFEDAKKVASAIATSSLVKTAFYGQDANWGRIVAAAGYAGVPFHPSQTNLYLYQGDISSDSYQPGKSLHLVKQGEPFQVSEEIASKILKETDVSIRMDLGHSSGSRCTMWTCDLSKEYVAINADYRS